MRTRHNMQSNYSLRKFCFSDINDIVTLLNLVFKPAFPFTEEWWIWKYQNNPAGFWGDQGDIWVAEDDGRIVGFYAVIPVKVKIVNKTVIIGQSVDTAVHPKYRRKGMFSALANRVYDSSRNRYSFLFGYPSEMAYKGFLSLGWKEFKVNELIKFINYDRPLNSFISNSLYAKAAKVMLKTWQKTKRLSFSLNNINHKLEGEDVTLERIDKFEDEFDVFWRTKSKENCVIVQRDVSYLNWRFSKILGDYQVWVGKSARAEKIIGYGVFRKTKTRLMKDVLDIVDLCALPKQERFVMAIIDESLRIGEDKNVDSIHFRVPSWHHYAKIFSSKGFLGMNRILELAGIFQSRLIMYNYGRQPLPKIQEWCYSLSDTDYA